MFERFKNSHEIYQELNNDVKYGIDFEWGQLRVTDQADRTFELVPLVPTLGRSETEQSQFARTDTQLVLCSRDQMGELFDNFSSRDNIFASTSAPVMGVSEPKNPNKLYVSSPLIKQELIELSDGAIANFADDFGINPDILIDENEIPIQEKMAQESSQYILHRMCAGIEDVLTQSEAKKRDDSLKHRLIGRTTLWGAGGLIAAGVVLGAAEAGNGPDASTYVTVGITSSIYIGCSQLEIMKFMTREKSNSELNYKIANIKAEKIANDIHNSYCTGRFDSKANEVFSVN